MANSPPSSASAGLQAGVASAALGVAQGEAGYLLTKSALEESEAVAVFPLLALSAGAIVEGLASYVAVQALWKVADETAKAQFAAMRKQTSQS